MQTSSLGKISTEFITQVNYDKIRQLDREYFKDRPKKTLDFFQDEEVKKIEPPTIKPPPVTPPFSHYQPPLPFETHSAKKDDERKGPSALERALMESSSENQESSTLERLVQEKVIIFSILTSSSNPKDPVKSTTVNTVPVTNAAWSKTSSLVIK